MKKFIVLMTQLGGCDHTIGCGMKWEIIEADSKEAALGKVFGNPEKIDKSAVNDPDYWLSRNAIISNLGEDGYPNYVEIIELGNIYISEKECNDFCGSIKNKIEEVGRKIEEAEEEI